MKIPEPLSSPPEALGMGTHYHHIFLFFV